jgi:hypothetical protein
LFLALSLDLNFLIISLSRIALISEPSFHFGQPDSEPTRLPIRDSRSIS